MAIHSFLKAEKGDPDWQFSPDDYYGKEFKIVDASVVEIKEKAVERIILRQTPIEKELLAKRLCMILNSNSVLDMIILNDVDSDLQQIFLYEIQLNPGSNLNLGIFVKDGKLNKHIIQVYQEEGSMLAIYGLVSNQVGGDSEVITKSVYNGKKSISNQLLIGLAGKDSQTVYTSTVVAEDDAFDSVIGIENTNLILDTGGRCYSKPETFILSENVISRSASEINKLDCEKIDYLQSKGIPNDCAINLLVNSFKNQVIELIQLENIRDEVKEMYSN
jgi:hypothetical protein